MTDDYFGESDELLVIKERLFAGESELIAHAESALQWITASPPLQQILHTHTVQYSTPTHSKKSNLAQQPDRSDF